MVDEGKIAFRPAVELSYLTKEEQEIDQYKVPGVWAMLGIKKTDNPKRKYTCLNVGKSICIRDELKINFERLSSFELFKDKVYKNQFNEVMFSYEQYATRQDMLYKEISENYNEIIFILVANQSQNTYIIEKYFAYSIKSAYWVSNGRYSSNHSIDISIIDNPFGRIPTGMGNTELVQVALSQEGNQGGQPYWSWYGFNSRVEWCACFVSWCAEQCGYLESGIIPRFSLCSDGVQWFRQRGQWQDGSYTPKAGDIIFFDWGTDGSIYGYGIPLY